MHNQKSYQPRDKQRKTQKKDGKNVCKTAPLQFLNTTSKNCKNKN